MMITSDVRWLFLDHHRVFCQGQFFHCKRRNQGWSSAQGRSSTTNPGTKVAVLPGISRCGSFPLLFSPHSLFSIWTDIRRFKKIPGAPTWRWGEWIWLTGPSELYRNSPQGLNISSIRVFDYSIYIDKNFHVIISNKSYGNI